MARSYKEMEIKMAKNEKNEKVFPVVNKEVKEVIEKYEVQIRETLVKAIEASNLLKDGKQILTFNKLSGVVQKLNVLHSHIKDWNEKDSN